MVLLLCVALAWTTLSLSFVGLARRVSAESTVALRAEEGAKSSGGTPVVDDSDFSDSDGSKESKEKRANFDDILTEADNFATSIERKSRRSTAVARVSLEDELRDLSKRKRWTGSGCLLLISSDSSIISISIQTFKRIAVSCTRVCISCKDTDHHRMHRSLSAVFCYPLSISQVVCLWRTTQTLT